MSTGAFGSELPKIAAFMRRDLLITLSYPAGFASDVVQLGGQVLMFGADWPPRRAGVAARVRRLADDLPPVRRDRRARQPRVRPPAGPRPSALRTEQLIGTLEALLVAPMRTATLQAGSVAFDAVQIPLRMGLFLAVIAIVAGLDLHVSGVLPSVTVLVATMPFVWGLGLVSAGAILTFRRGGGVTGLAAMLLGLSSGAFFPLSVLPPGLESVLSWNPLAICLDSIRGALIGGEGWGAIGPDLLVLVPLSVASLAAGAAAFRAAVARELRRGTLGRY